MSLKQLQARRVEALKRIQGRRMHTHAPTPIIPLEEAIRSRDPAVVRAQIAFRRDAIVNANHKLVAIRNAVLQSEVRALLAYLEQLPA